MADTERLVEFLLRANRLKSTPRTGWVQRGVQRPESVADHSHGVALAALLLADLAAPQADRTKIMTMAVLHDLAEAVTGDLSGRVAVAPPRGQGPGRGGRHDRTG